MLKMLADYLPYRLTEEIEKLPSRMLADLEEIRLRAGRPVVIVADAEKYLLGRNEMVNATAQDIEEVLSALTGHSIYSRAESILSGYFAVPGGIRVGLAGNYLYEGNRLSGINGFSGLCIRIPREIKGLAGSIARFVSLRGYVQNLLIISPPGQGKTTLLRDIVRSVASGEDFRQQSCCVVDERCEIAGAWAGQQSFELGAMCDVLNGARKPDGIRMAVRSLAPEVIATDEIGDAADMRALMEARNAGVTVVATAHAQNLERLRGRLLFAKMMDEGLFSRYVLLGCSRGRGTVEAVYNERYVNICTKSGETNENSAVCGHFDLHVCDRS